MSPRPHFSSPCSNDGADPSCCCSLFQDYFIISVVLRQHEDQHDDAFVVQGNTSLTLREGQILTVQGETVASPQCANPPICPPQLQGVSFRWQGGYSPYESHICVPPPPLPDMGSSSRRITSRRRSKK